MACFHFIHALAFYFSDMKKANTRGADKYFYAKGNYEAAKRGTGGRHASAVIRYFTSSNELAFVVFCGIFSLLLNHYILGNFLCFFCRLLIIFQN